MSGLAQKTAYGFVKADHEKSQVMNPMLSWRWFDDAARWYSFVRWILAIDHSSCS